MAGIWNHTIVDFIEKKTSDDVKKTFVGVFSSHYVTRFITFCSMMTEIGARYPFTIMNADHCHKKGTHWWSFLDLYPKKTFLFESFGSEGSKELLLQGNRKTLNKILYGIKKFAKKDKKVTIITLNFSMIEYEKIKNANRLSTTTQDLLYLIDELRKNIT